LTLSLIVKTKLHTLNDTHLDDLIQSMKIYWQQLFQNDLLVSF